MRFELDATVVLSVALVATRLAAMLLMTPILGFSVLPAQLRMLITMMLSFAIASAAGFPAPVPGESDGLALSLVFGREALLGAAMGFGLRTAFGAVMLAGRLLDYQMGFAAALMFDPASRTQAPLFGTTLSMLGAVLFFSMDGHHAVVRALVESLAVRPHEATSGAEWIQPVVGQFGLLFAYGFALVAAPLAALALVDIGVAFSSRTMPQVNAYFVALPVKVFAGVAILALSLRIIEPVITALFDSVLQIIAPAPR